MHNFNNCCGGATFKSQDTIATIECLETVRNDQHCTVLKHSSNKFLYVSVCVAVHACCSLIQASILSLNCHAYTATTSSRMTIFVFFSSARETVTSCRCPTESEFSASSSSIDSPQPRNVTTCRLKGESMGIKRQLYHLIHPSLLEGVPKLGVSVLI